ncbi:MAG: hypothetical protein JO202_04350 [Ktedonobacteraceae bacterium]|nr:hypothetical protein [Ktedonobacteraceae bacterium]
MKDLDNFYTASQAREKLGRISAEKLKRLVNTGKIEKMTPPTNKKKGYYNKLDVDKLAKAEQPFTQNEQEATKEEVNKKTPGKTDWASSSDLPYMLAYDYELYGPENTVDISITRPRWEKNPHMARILFDANDRRNLWGGITIMPMEEETIFRLLRDEIQERDIRPEHILTYEVGKKYYGYIASATVRPEHKIHFRELAESVLKYWCEQYPDIQLIKLYAYTAGEEGLDLLKHFFFSPRYDLGDNAYELNPYQRNPSKIIKAFQKCIKEKALK